MAIRKWFRTVSFAFSPYPSFHHKYFSINYRAVVFNKKNDLNATIAYYRDLEEA